MKLEGEKVLPHRLKVMAAYTFILSLFTFCPLLTGLVVHDREESRATAEVTPLAVRSLV